MIKTTFEAQFMKKLSDTETEFEKSVAYKKACTPFQFRLQMFSLLKSSFCYPFSRYLEQSLSVCCSVFS